jgi:hypothetical protein
LFGAAREDLQAFKLEVLAVWQQRLCDRMFAISLAAFLLHLSVVLAEPCTQRG